MSARGSPCLSVSRGSATISLCGELSPTFWKPSISTFCWGPPHSCLFQVFGFPKRYNHNSGPDAQGKVVYYHNRDSMFAHFWDIHSWNMFCKDTVLSNTFIFSYSSNLKMIFRLSGIDNKPIVMGVYKPVIKVCTWLHVLPVTTHYVWSNSAISPSFDDFVTFFAANTVKAQSDNFFSKHI